MGWLALLLALGGSRLIRAELPTTRLWTLSPPGGMAGTRIEVTAAGADLDRSTQLIFSHTNIVAKLDSNDSAADLASHRFQVAIGEDVVPGIYETRVVGRFGASNPRAFVVSGRHEITPARTNTTLAQAIRIELGTVVNGYAEPAAVTYFSLTVAKGQRILLACATRAIDSRMEPALFVWDAAGRELARNRRSGLLDFTAAADGVYVVKLHDLTFRGGPEYFYRLTVSAGPHVDFVFPAAAVAGKRTRQMLYGRSLPGASPAEQLALDSQPLERMEVEVEMPLPGAAARRFPLLPLRSASAALEGVEYRLTSTNWVSNPIFIAAASGPIVLEAEPNNSAELAQEVPLPCEFQGQFYPAGDRDWISFVGRKGEVYFLEVVSERMGFPTAPFLLVQRVGQNERGEEQISDVQEVYGAETNLGGAAFNTATRDPSYRLEVKEDTKYRVQIRDLFNSGQAGPGRLYRLALRKESPGFQLLATPLPPPQLDRDRREARVWPLNVRRGETLPIKVIAFRRDTFDGEIRLTIDGLPPGTSCSGGRIGPGSTSGVLLVSAAENATTWSGPIKITGTAQIAGSDRVQSAKAGTVVWDVADYNLEAIQSRLAGAFYLAVAADEKAPAWIQAREQTTFTAPVGGKVQIPLRVNASAELTGNIKWKAAGLAAFDGTKELELSSKTNQASLELDLAQLKISPGTYEFYVFAQAQAKYRRLAPDDLKPAEVAAQAAELAAKEAEGLAAQLQTEADQIKALATDKGKAATDKLAGDEAIAKAFGRAVEAQKKKEKLAQESKAAAQRLQFEERSFTAYTGALTLHVSPAPAVSASVGEAAAR